MKEEERIIKALTGKLVKVAKWPNMRKHFVVGWALGQDSSLTVNFYKDDPKMSNIEYVALINNYIAKLEFVKNGDEVWSIIDKCFELFDWDAYAQSVYEYIDSKANLIDEEDSFVLTAIAQINNIVELPKRERNKKGSFDYNYAKAEKGDKEYQLLVAKAYREGDGVPKNIRLANLWEEFANNKIVE